jgi:hypothetical protein
MEKERGRIVDEGEVNQRYVRAVVRDRWWW